MPAVAKILIIFFAMLTLTKVRVPLGLALIFAGIALNLWAGYGPGDTAVFFFESLLSADVWLMVIITTMVVEFGRFMTEKENADELLGVISRWGGKHGKTWSLMAVPAVVGLIPMPAGALFSAPLVGQASNHTTRSKEWKATINYWFRHVWEYWWVLYPGVIVAIKLFDMRYWRFFLTQFPFTIVAVGSGYMFLIHSHLRELSTNLTEGKRPTGRLFAILLPLCVVVAGMLALPQVLEKVMPQVAKSNVTLLALLVSLAVGLVFIVRDEKKKEGRVHIFSSLLKPKSLGMLLTILGVMVFQHMLNFSGMVGIASRELQSSNINLVYVIAALPFLAGLITGIAVGFVSASFPFVVGLLNVSGSGLHPMSTLILAYGFGYMGMMLSPVHLCLLVTREYFNCSLPGIYRHLLPCALAILTLSVLGHILLHMLGL